jgi:hypothetical protein
MTAAQPRRGIWLLTAAVASLAVFEAGLAWNTHGVAQEGARARTELVARITGFRETVIDQVQEAHEQFVALRGQIDEAREAAGPSGHLTGFDRLGHAVEGMALQRVRYEDHLSLQLSALRTESGVLRGRAESLGRTLDATREELAATKQEHRAAAGGLDGLDSLGRQSARALAGPAATLAPRQFALELTRQRPYGEFGGISVALRAVDPKRNRYRVELAAGGRTIGLAERTLNEPLLFHTGASRRACELVVEEIGPGSIRGRLTVPGADRTGH